MLPVGFPIDPLPGEQTPIDDMMLKTLTAVLTELQQMNRDRREALTELREIRRLLEAQAEAKCHASADP